MLLRIDRLSKAYLGPSGRLEVLRDLSLELAPGDFVAVRGPSGCGKSTLLLAAGGLLAPDVGSVVLEGEDLYALSSEQRASVRARKIGFVFQQFHLVPYLSARENVLAAGLGVGWQDTARAEELLARLGLAGRAGHVPAQLSIGERQRTALARALFNRPRLLLADEPTGNLDPGSGQAVLTQLADFAAGGGAVLLVTHEAAAAASARRVVTLDQGRLLDEGAMHEQESGRGERGGVGVGPPDDRLRR
jgi:ABC-type lipoprotein export system ATPase subunit